MSKTERLFYQNDCKSLAACADNRYGLIFSFDSLVHADMETLSSYIGQIVPMLEPVPYASFTTQNLGEDGQDVPNPGFRGADVTGEKVEAATTGTAHEPFAWAVDFGDASPCDMPLVIANEPELSLFLEAAGLP